MSGNLATKRVKSIALSDYIPQPKAILKGARGPWPLTQSKVLELFLSREGEPIFRDELLTIFEGNRNPVDKSIQLINLRLKKYGARIKGYQVYIIEPTEPDNQLKLFN